MKKLYTLSIVLLTTLSFGQVALPHYEGFDYTSGLVLQTQTNWSVLGTPAATNDDISTATNSLTYSGLTSIGGKVSYSAGGNDSQKLITPQTTGTTYYSLLLNITSMAGVTDVSGGYFAGFAANATTFGGSLWAKRIDDNSFNIGVEVRTANLTNTTFSANNYVTGQTYLVVVSYTFGTGAGDDVVKMWINPVLGGTEPVALVTDSHAATDLANINSFFLRQDSVTETGLIQIDEVRIGNTWASVTPSNLSVNQNQIAGLNINPNPVSKGVFYINTSANETKNVVIVDLLGKQVLNTTTDGNEINVSNLNAGVYIVKVTEEGKTATRKLVIQ